MEKELRRELKKRKNFIDFFSTQFDAMAKRSVKTDKENAALKKENLHLAAEWKRLNEVVMSSEQRTTSLEQYSRSRTIEITGLPAVDRENLPAMLRMLGDAIDERISETDVNVCHRAPRTDQGYCYKRSIVISDIREALFIKQCARKYLMEDLLKLAEEFIKRNVNPENLIEYMELHLEAREPEFDSVVLTTLKSTEHI
ncbi:hypothetical protein HPB48_015063 [Haemaphysalis longicornis]|uniref:Uncharacterized protein n=1 Tax=Haemaphysalis longicornis TaxID=44386 RepID=A0A9J6GPH6_HAELO|nr:hypothetical protein HPB48_015063 [Haemaphysalis longicornis]